MSLVAALVALSAACVDGTAQPGPSPDQLGQAQTTGGTASSAGSGGSSATAGSGSSAGGTVAAGGSVAMAGSSAGGGSAGTAGSASGGAANGTINATATDAANAYATFKTYFETCSDGTVRVKTNGDETVSEGIAYGMLAAVGNDDHTSFDGLWNYYKAHKNGNGLMDWKIAGCSSTVWEAGAATDAELDAAMALIQAECKWGGYASDATTLLSAIKTHETASAGSELVLKPGDYWGGADCTNPSYFAPGYYRVFAAFQPGEAGTWNKLASDSYVILGRADNDSTGLVPDWSDAWGKAGGGNGCRNDKVNYTYDAARTPWRIATDYQWFGTAEAQAWLTKVTNWVPDIYNIGDGFSLSGSQLSSYHNSAFVGAFALGAMANSEEKKNLFMGAFLAVNPSADNAYYQAALRAVYMLLAADMFAQGC